MDSSDCFLLELDFSKEKDETIKWLVKKEKQEIHMPLLLPIMN
jgi:hypothetical protein